MTSSTSRTESRSSSYREAGVDIDKAEQSLSAIKRMARSTLSVSQTLGEIGHFGGVFPLRSGPDRLLVASADGIGTKLKLAFVLGGPAHTQVGADLVNHCVNDIAACGASPLFFLDYVAMGRLDSPALESLIDGMASACRENGVALIGGETAEMPGLYRDGEYDAAGFIVGEVAPDHYIDGREIRPGDVVIGFPALGLHTNGFSLARLVVGINGDPEHDREVLAEPLGAGSTETLGSALMAPHPSYLATIRPLLEAGIVRGMAHITGGGLVDNVPRMLPPGATAVLDQAAWTVNPIFDELVRRGRIAAGERYRVFNMGIGFTVAVRSEDVSAAIALAPGARVIGHIAEAGSEGDARVLIVNAPES